MKLILSLDSARIPRVKKLEKQQPLHVRLDFQGVKTHVYTNSSYLAGHLRLGYRYFETMMVNRIWHYSHWKQRNRSSGRALRTSSRHESFGITS